MAASFFFYDLETSGINPRDDRIMQFAGQRTDLDLNPIGDPVNVLVKLTPDVVPSPDAIMITGITPQSTLSEGLTEIEFLKLFYEEVAIPGTIFTGFNTVRFDDEFMRYLHYRNFYDAYEWQWCDDCSRWDLLDLLRMTRALRPDGIEWPFTSEGKPTNRLELLTSLNGVEHEHAHDALNDVVASIAVAKLVRDKQPSLYDYLFAIKGKKDCKARVEEFAASGQPFLYTSGRYSTQWLHTTAVYLIGSHPEQACGYVYDLRVDPNEFVDMSVDQLAECARYSRDPEQKRLPIKSIKYNRCPAIAPMGILKDETVQERLQLTVETVQTNMATLRAHGELIERMIEAYERVSGEKDTYYNQSDKLGSPQDVDGQLYEGLLKADGPLMRRVQQLDVQHIDQVSASDFSDKRLQSLWPLYKARNFSSELSSDERAAWDEFCAERLMGGGNSSRLAKYFKRIEELAHIDTLTENQRYLLEELHLYGESIVPAYAETDAE